MKNVIEDFSKIMAPLRELRKQTVKFSWGRKHQNAFEKMRSCLSEDNVFGSFEIGKPTEVHEDFHKTGLGATILQEENGKWCSIMYIIHSTTQQYQAIHKQKVKLWQPDGTVKGLIRVFPYWWKFYYYNWPSPFNIYVK